MCHEIVYWNFSSVFEKEMLWMQGLVTKERKELDPSAAPFAKDPREIEGLTEGAGLVEVVNFTGLLRLLCVKVLIMYDIMLKDLDTIELNHTLL
jgi:hypothetical protein